VPLATVARSDVFDQRSSHLGKEPLVVGVTRYLPEMRTRESAWDGALGQRATSDLGQPDLCWQFAHRWRNIRPMPDDLYDRDILYWAESQADLLRRLGRGEAVNGVDWDHVVDEIEDVGRSELHAVQSHLNLMLLHLLKIWLLPNNETVGHWRAEVVAFQKNTVRRFAPSMRQRIDLVKLYDDAIEQLEAGGQTPNSVRQWPATCPFTLDQLLGDRWDALEHRLNAAAGQLDIPPAPPATNPTSQG